MAGNKLGDAGRHPFGLHLPLPSLFLSSHPAAALTPLHLPATSGFENRKATGTNISQLETEKEPGGWGAPV